MPEDWRTLGDDPQWDLYHDRDAERSVVPGIDPQDPRPRVPDRPSPGDLLRAWIMVAAAVLFTFVVVVQIPGDANASWGLVLPALMAAVAIRDMRKHYRECREWERRWGDGGD